MKFNSKNILTGICMALFTMFASSCEDYLDKAPESDISSEVAFKNFTNFQGFTEELYACMPDFAKRYWTGSWNWGEDEIVAVGIDYHVSYRFDLGNFWGWQNDGTGGWNAGWMDIPDASTSGDGRFGKALWPLAWYGIRKCNMGIENLDLLKEATQEEKDMIAGQLYFFRGWFHFQLFQYFGGLPYIDHVLGGEALTLPRETYRSNAMKAAADFRKAADLLPIDWDNTAPGKNTLGHNGNRVNKITALGYLGKNYLWAASPLMAGESVGANGHNKYDFSRSTYDYDKVYADSAAMAFGELLKLVESNQTQYKLVDFKNYSDIFYTIDRNAMTPGSTEAILRTATFDWNSSNWGISKQFGGQHLGDGKAFSQPCANYVNYYGMANGLPLTDSESGFDPTHPWKDRDPRFYNDIVYDGVRVVKKLLTGDNEKYQYAGLYTDGPNRDPEKEIRTGYMLYKFIDITCNQYDKGWDGHTFHINIPWMRLSDIYLMYGESLAAAGKYEQTAGGCPLSGRKAIDKVRERAGVDPINAKFTGNGLMDEIRRERAVELAYESHRFNDLRRWLLLDKKPYTIKTSQEFERVGEFDTEDPTLNEVGSWREETILTRDLDSKHYWLPLKREDVSIYPELYQNEGY